MACMWTVLLLATNLIFYSGRQSLFTMGQIPVVKLFWASLRSPGSGGGVFLLPLSSKGKGKVIPLQAQCGPEGG